MKNRFTFVHGASDSFKLEQLQLDKDTLDVKSLKAAREDRSTFSLHDLPEEVFSIDSSSDLINETDISSYDEC